MRVGLLTEGGYPYVRGTARLWCERLVRGLGQHEFDIYALSRSARQERGGWVRLAGNVGRVRTAPLWSAPDTAPAPHHGRRARRRFAEHYAELVKAVCTPDPAGEPAVWEDGPGDRAPRDAHASEADRFASALYALAAFARDEGTPAGLLRSDLAVRTLERACRAPGALRAARTARVVDLLTVVAGIERLLRPLSLDWYGERDLGGVDLCHAASGGAAALPGLLARHFAGVPLLLTEYGVALRAQYLAEPAASAPVRALQAAFHGRLAVEGYRQAACVTPGNAHTRRWQERCGAQRAKLRTVHPGIDASRFAEVGERNDPGEPGTLLWIGRIEPGKDLVSLLHAFAEVRRAEPGARLRIVGGPAEGPGAVEYTAHCKALAAQLFPDEAEDRHTVGENPVSFEEPGGPGAAHLAEAYAAGSVVVLSSVVEGFPAGLVEAMFSGRATVSTDVGAVVEVIGGTGLVVPPRNPRALAEACVSLLRNPSRRALLGAAARARALELFSVEQNILAFHGIYLDIAAQCPAPGRRTAAGPVRPRPFAVPAKAHLPAHWPTASAPRRPSWARGPGGVDGSGGADGPGGVGGAAQPRAVCRAAEPGEACRAAEPRGGEPGGAAAPTEDAQPPASATVPAAPSRPRAATTAGFGIAVGAAAVAGVCTGAGVAGACAGGVVGAGTAPAGACAGSGPGAAGARAEAAGERPGVDRAGAAQVQAARIGALRADAPEDVARTEAARTEAAGAGAARAEAGCAGAGRAEAGRGPTNAAAQAGSCGAPRAEGAQVREAAR
ncbi:hypothetical protein GCM10018793_39130 [Streptomyces sulfonofaciens]|uniref:D-inositol 3-phosphate glycosyltransferase n=1 Tax=Streptomyces sulfonofaciens TaxID=68272 RepID=A0A919L3P1_9ACTN|nr:hypothetical protein GCM10018793_39130 [Streptomyces sulfonofaciens]